MNINENITGDKTMEFLTEEYVSPEIEIIKFNLYDVICTSSDLGEEDDGEEVEGEHIDI